ncbi:hypothetical protein PR202_gb09902 [Eleusine coracana subsp. coracana]|uniref:Uncharacterized protein n=1 Tax=Eleusine coracana subsp. coracana TaxID=191504 RepID=A0AAV5EIK4_ELECO|nr:hypothetical protein PR202_gb09902 [Eleusine coracana subsp. coracana]
MRAAPTAEGDRRRAEGRRQEEQQGGGRWIYRAVATAERAGRPGHDVVEEEANSLEVCRVRSGGAASAG